MSTDRVLHVLGGATLGDSAFARIVSGLSQSVARRFEIEVLFLGAAGPLLEQLRGIGVKTERIDWPRGWRQPLGAMKFLSFLRRKRFSIVHVHFGGRSVRWLARLSGARVVFHVHSHVAEFRDLERMKTPTGGADVVVADCRVLANSIVGAISKVVYLGVPVSDVRSADARSKDFLVGCLGRLARVKGTVDLVRAVDLIAIEAPRLKVEIAGTGPEEAALRDEVRIRGLEDRIRFLGWVENPAEVTRRWNVMAQPSIDDGFPLSVLEAMSAAVPVIGSAVGGIPEMIENGRTGWLIPPGDPSALARALLSAYSDPDQVQAVGQAAREAVKTRFSVERMTRDIESIYDELLERDRR